jgi:glycosyltransferase involved in cell wall biosynthesis
MRILFVSMDVPFPTTRGQRMRNWALVRVLFEEGHQVVLVSFAEPQDMNGNRDVLQSVCEKVELVPLPSASTGKWKQYAGRLISLLSPLPYGAWRFRSPALRRTIREILEHDSFDVIVWDEVYNLVNLERDLPIPVLLNSHDLMHIIWKRYLDVEQSPFKRAYAWLEYRKLMRWEPQACSVVGSVMACSKHDSSLYRRMNPQTPVTVVTNSVDTKNYQATPGDDDGRTVLFVGGMDWFPNRDAVEFFASAVLPELRRLTRNFKFVVAGRAPSAKLLRRFASAPEIHFTGTVPDMRAVIATAAVCIVPLRIGSGVRWKILEAGAMGKSIVSTRIGVEGLDFADGDEILLADDPRDFAAAVAGLLADRSRREELGRAARRRVDEQYSFRSLRAAVREALSTVEGNKALATKEDPTSSPV